MEKNLAEADRVLMLCTENYVQKANNGAGGVGYEKMIMTADLLMQIDSNKVIPLIRQSGTTKVPRFLQSKLYIDFSREDQFELGFDNLVRSIHGKPLFVGPPVSNNPFFPVLNSPVERTGDGVLMVVKTIVKVFESDSSVLISYDSILRNIAMSRIMVDLYISEAVNEKLVEYAHRNQSFMTLTDKGKQYAIHNKLVRVH